MGHCPTEEELRRLGDLEEAARCLLAAHVDSCQLCQAALERMSDDLADELRGVFLVASPRQRGRCESEWPRAASRVGEDPPPSDDRIPPEFASHPRYTGLEWLGEGGMGRVFKAFDERLRRTVAIKIIRPEGLAHAQAAARMLREAHAAARLTHPNIVVVYDVGRVGRTCYIAMEYVEGVSLSRFVKRAGPLPPETACLIGQKVCESLDECHAHGIVHRDVKPSNIMVDAKGNVKVLDFGLARFAVDSQRDGPITATECLLGTPEFMAPEQALSPRDADTRSDIYSLGCTLYYLLTACYPFPDRSSRRQRPEPPENEMMPLADVRSDLPAGLAEVIGRMTAERPEDRFQTPIDAARALAPFAARSLSGEGSLEIGKLLVPAADVPRQVRKPSFARADSLFRGTVSNPRRPMRLVGLVIGLLAAVVGLAFSPHLVRITTGNGQLVIETSDPDVEILIKRGGKGVRIVDLKTDRALDLKAGEYEIELTGRWDGLRISPAKVLVTRGGKTIVTVRRDARTVPHGSPGRELRRFEGHTASVGSVAFSPDGRQALTASNDQTVRLWEVETGSEIRRFTGHDGLVLSAVFSPNGQRILSCGADKTIRLWNARTGVEIRRFEGHTDWVWRAVFSSDGRRIVSGSYDFTARLWDADSGQQLRVFAGHTLKVRAVALSRDGTHVITGSDDQSIRLWRSESGQLIRSFDQRPGWTWSADFSPDGHHALTDHGTIVSLWDVDTGHEIRQMLGHTGWIRVVALSRDGKRALSGSTDKTVRLWDTQTGRQIACLEGHQHEVRGVAFSPDGRLALSCGEDGTVRLWALPR